MSKKAPLKIVFGTASFGDPAHPQAKFNTVESAKQVLDVYRERGYTELDSAIAYPVGLPGTPGRGTSEALLGKLGLGEWATVDSKVLSWFPGAHTKDKIERSVKQSLQILNVNKIHIEYLHAPDRSTPFAETCEGMNNAYQRGEFERFGISNYTAEEVEEIVAICEKNGWVKPTVYQGQYNALARKGEEELFPVLRKHGISFYAYSPSAGGFLSDKVSREAVNERGSRWDSETRLGVVYAKDYFKDALFEAASNIKAAAKEAGITGHAVALRWAIHHSALSAEHGDAVVLGASSVAQLTENLDICEAGPLDEKIVQIVNDSWTAVKPHAPHYYT